MALQEMVEPVPAEEQKPQLEVLEGGEGKTYPEMIGGTTNQEALLKELVEISQKEQVNFTDAEFTEAINLLKDPSNIKELKVTYTGEIGGKGVAATISPDTLTEAITNEPLFVFYFTKGYHYQNDLTAGLAYASKMLHLGE